MMSRTIGKINWEWLVEGKEEQLFHRVSSGDLANFIQMDMVENPSELERLFDIASLTNEGCRGYLVFSNEEAQEAIERNLPYIYYVGHIPYGFEPYLYDAEGAMCYCYSPHVFTKIKNHRFYYGELDANTEKELCKEKDRLVTVSPKDGGVFRGNHKLISQKPLDNLHVKKLYEYVKKYVSFNKDGCDTIKAWVFIDIILNTYTSPYALEKEYHIPSNHDYPCLSYPQDRVDYFDDMDYDNDMRELLTGVIMSIKRVMGFEVPTSKHYKYYRPLFDPMDYITAEEYEDSIGYIQTTGLEFYDLHRYSKKYNDIHNIKIYFETVANGWKYKFNYLDVSNPYGADLVLNVLPRRNILLYLNDKKIEKNNIIPAFSEIRNREFEFLENRKRFVFFGSMDEP